MHAFPPYDLSCASSGPQSSENSPIPKVHQDKNGLDKKEILLKGKLEKAAISGAIEVMILLGAMGERGM